MTTLVAASQIVDNLLGLWPPSASDAAVQTDRLILAFTILTLFLTVPVFLAITWFSIRYRDGKKVDRTNTDERSSLIELSWMIIPFVLSLIFFVWGAFLFHTHQNPPANAMHIAAVGRQWMWKFQHPGGQAEINDLHVPIHTPIVIDMISQDVIHGLYIPALRIQGETLPGRRTQIWFNADRAGRYHLFCSEYCGTDHSRMEGVITIMQPAEYETWLAQQDTGSADVAEGQHLFSTYGCSGCHSPQSTVRAPSLAGLFGRAVPLESGATVTADAAFIRDKILNPNAMKIAGYKQVMPAFAGKISDDDLGRLVAYIRQGAQHVDAAP